MARGISEQDVFEAADKLLARGERPTIERVRLELGRGSPNTVNRLLDGWWSGLAGRIVAQESSKLPAQFQAACERLYDKAVADSRSQAEQAVESRHVEVTTRLAALAAKEAELASRESTLSAPIEMLRLDLATANQRVVDLSTRNGLLTSELEQLQKSDLKREQQVAAAKEALSSVEAKAKAEMLRVRSQWEAQENRWLRQIDALRDDLKLMRLEKIGEKRAANQKISELQTNIGKLEKRLLTTSISKSSSGRPKSRGAADLKKAERRRTLSAGKP